MTSISFIKDQYETLYEILNSDRSKICDARNDLIVIRILTIHEA